jgi:transmembrane sensor
MSNVIELPNREPIHDQASLWIARLDRELSAAEQQELQRWLHQNPEHKAVLFEMAALWDKMDSLTRLAGLFQPPIAHKSHRMSYFYGAAAASMILAILFTLFNVDQLAPAPLQASHITNPMDDFADKTYFTPIGEHTEVNLPDGSLLSLNTNSRVKVTYTTEQRVFLLEQGEINIKVAHNKDRPLSVIANNKVVQAVGTAFNVRIYKNSDVELIVTEGKVLVAEHEALAINSEPASHKHLAVKDISTKTFRDGAMAVSKGEKIVFSAKSAKVEKIAEPDIAAELGWREGNLVFRGETLEQALGEISRYSAIEFEVPDERIKQTRIAGLFRAGDVDGLLQTLDQNFDIQSTTLPGNKVRLSAR